jgi:hypothetical protein
MPPCAHQLSMRRLIQLWHADVLACILHACDAAGLLRSFLARVWLPSSGLIAWHDSPHSSSLLSPMMPAQAPSCVAFLTRSAWSRS